MEKHLHHEQNHASATLEKYYLPVLVNSNSMIELIEQEITYPISDKDLFRLLKRTHDSYRGWRYRYFGVYRIEQIRFVRFRVLYESLVEPLKLDCGIPFGPEKDNWACVPCADGGLVSPDLMLDLYHRPRRTAPYPQVSLAVPTRLHEPVGSERNMRASLGVLLDEETS